QAALAGVANAQGDHVLALLTAEPALRACIDESFPVGMRSALIEAVEAAFRMGQVSKVDELLNSARATFEQLGATPWLQRARLAVRRVGAGLEPATLAQ